MFPFCRSFKPPSLALVAGGKGRDTFELSTTAATPKGTYPLKLTVTAGGVTHSVNATLVVQ